MSRRQAGEEKGKSREIKDLFPFSFVLTKLVKILNNIRNQSVVRQLFRWITYGI